MISCCACSIRGQTRACWGKSAEMNNEFIDHFKLIKHISVQWKMMLFFLGGRRRHDEEKCWLDEKWNVFQALESKTTSLYIERNMKVSPLRKIKRLLATLFLCATRNTFCSVYIADKNNCKHITRAIRVVNFTLKCRKPSVTTRNKIVLLKTNIICLSST